MPKNKERRIVIKNLFTHYNKNKEGDFTYGKWF